MGLGLEARIALATNHRRRPHGCRHSPDSRQWPELHRGRLQDEREQRHRGEHRRESPVRRRVPAVRREHVQTAGRAVGHQLAGLPDPGHVTRSRAVLAVRRQGEAMEPVHT